MSAPRPLAVVCVSGGMDSAVTAATAARDHELAFLHASYGQRTEGKELACVGAAADAVADTVSIFDVAVNASIDVTVQTTNVCE